MGMPERTGPSGRLIVVGVVKGAHGVRGEVRVKSFTDDPERLFTYGPLLGATGIAVLTPVSARPGKDHFIVTVREACQKEVWDGLRGTLLHVPRSALAPAEADEFYIEDLVGLAACDSAGAVCGRVQSVQNYGAGDLLEIDVEGEAATVLVPFTLADVTQIDLGAGRVTIPHLADWAAAPEA